MSRAQEKEKKIEDEDVDLRELSRHNVETTKRAVRVTASKPTGVRLATGVNASACAADSGLLKNSAGTAVTGMTANNSITITSIAAQAPFSIGHISGATFNSAGTDNANKVNSVDDKKSTNQSGVMCSTNGDYTRLKHLESGQNKVYWHEHFVL